MHGTWPQKEGSTVQTAPRTLRLTGSRSGRRVGPKIAARRGPRLAPASQRRASLCSQEYLPFAAVMPGARGRGSPAARRLAPSPPRRGRRGRRARPFLQRELIPGDKLAAAGHAAETLDVVHLGARAHHEVVFAEADAALGAFDPIQPARERDGSGAGKEESKEREGVTSGGRCSGV